MIQSPRKFLCEFLLAGALLLVGWTYISDLYLELLLGGVNLGLWFTNASIFLRSGEPIGQGVVCPDVIAAAALFAASSGRSLRWRLGGTAVAVILLWFLQAALIVLELQLVSRQLAGLEIVALVRDWTGPVLVLMLWIGGCGSLLGSRAEQESPRVSAPKSAPKSISAPVEPEIGYRYKTRTKTHKGQNKHRQRYPQESSKTALQPTLS